MADAIKCPNCSGNLIFDADQQMMVCEYCMSRFTAEELANTIVEEPKDDSTAGERIHKEQAKEHIRKGLGDQGVQFICNACGAQVVTDQNTSATFCAFCGSPAIISQRMTDEFSPDYIIPFKFSKERASVLYREGLKKKWFLPNKFKKLKEALSLYSVLDNLII